MSERMASWQPVAAAALCALLVHAAPARPAPSDAVARGDEAFLRRAVGGRDGRAAPEPIDEAIRAYQEAVESDPRDLEARWKLLRALHFRAEFATPDRETRRAVLERGRVLAEEGVADLAERVGEGRPLHELAPEALARAPASRHDVAALYFWSTVHWAAWSRLSGLLSAVRQGVAGRLRDYTLLVLSLEPELEGGGAHRMMAALHARLPRVPLLSGWVDRSRALPHVERALAIDPEHPGNHLLLALTLLDLQPDERRAEALAVLERVSEVAPRAGTEVEDLAVRREARQRLERERAGDGRSR